jgi:DNA/RNA endonuclease YhcR with UshA esterase domain
MKCCAFTKPDRPLAGLLTLLLFAVSTIPVSAETAYQPRPYYDITKEVTLTGTVSIVLAKPSPGMIVGSHLLLSTAYGVVDASLGRFGLAGKDALPVAPGERVEVTGVMKTLRDRQVFVVRTVTVDGQVFTMRNEHGIPVPPQARGRANQKFGQRGESL